MRCFAPTTTIRTGKRYDNKFILAAITAIVGIITLIVGDNEAVKIIAGAAMTIVPTVVYCLMEGILDAKSINTITEATADAAEKLGADKATVNVINQVGAVGEVLAEGDKNADTSE